MPLQNLIIKLDIIKGHGEKHLKKKKERESKLTLNAARKVISESFDTRCDRGRF